MADNWDEGDMDVAKLKERPPTNDDVQFYCDKYFPYLHLINDADDLNEDGELSLSEVRLSCGWYVYCYHRGDDYLMLMCSRYAGRPNAPLPASAPGEMGLPEDEAAFLAQFQHPNDPGMAARDPQEGSEAGGNSDDLPANDLASDTKDDIGDFNAITNFMWGGDDGTQENELGWQAMSRLAATEMVEFAAAHGIKEANITGGSRYMLESAYLAAKSIEGDFELSTTLDEAQIKRLDTRVAHLTQHYNAQSAAEAAPD